MENEAAPPINFPSQAFPKGPPLFMFFNAYEIKPCGANASGGNKLVRFAFVDQNTCGDVFQVCIPLDVLRGVREEHADYFRSLEDQEVASNLVIPKTAHLLNPVLINRLTFAHFGGNHGEIGFQSTIIQDLAKRRDVETKFPIIQVALLHADIPLYNLVCLDLMADYKTKESTTNG
ncbi:MAG: hypothetical protein LBS59_04685 [Puniceicoccales bacterium]|nr:hypothetical protein [Puniceicoccales bacterium]